MQVQRVEVSKARGVITAIDKGGGVWVHAWGEGFIQDFEGGTIGPSLCIYRKGTQQAYKITGSIRETWLNSNGIEGPAGFPTGDARDPGTGLVQHFEGGRIEWSTVKNVFWIFPK